MLDGWYCRTIANMQATEAASTTNNQQSGPLRPETSKDYSSDSSSEQEPEPNYKSRYISMRKKLKYLIYENECFQDALRSSQKRLLKISRDRSFLLDRLLQYEKPDMGTTSESEETESSDDTNNSYVDPMRRKKYEVNSHQNAVTSSHNKPSNPLKRKRQVSPKKPTHNHLQQSGGVMTAKSSTTLNFGQSAGDGHMTPEEVERHLQSRQSYLELLPERAPPTVPTEMFSNDPSLDSESNDVLENSPNVEEWLD